MTATSWFQLGAVIAVLVVAVPLLGRYLTAVHSDGKAPGDRVFLPIERLVYRLVGVDPGRGQTWPAYTRSVIGFGVVSVLGLYLLLRVQGSLPLNPTGVDGFEPALAFNTAVSFVTGTNWQAYAGENTASHGAQMFGLVVGQFTAAAVGMSVALAMVRGLRHRRRR